MGWEERRAHLPKVAELRMSRSKHLFELERVKNRVVATPHFAHELPRKRDTTVTKFDCARHMAM